MAILPSYNPWGASVSSVAKSKYSLCSASELTAIVPNSLYPPSSLAYVLVGLNPIQRVPRDVA